jgi:hypothetical protein
VRFLTLDVGDETDSTGVMLVAGMIQSLGLGQSCHMYFFDLSIAASDRRTALVVSQY